MTIRTDPPNEDFEGHLQQSLEDDAQQVPPEIASRLAAIRHEAVQQIPEQRTSWFAHRQLLATASGVAAIVMVAVLMTIGLGGDEDLMLIPMTADAEIAAAQELEILEELEFLAWLEEEDSSAG